MSITKKFIIGFLGVFVGAVLIVTAYGIKVYFQVEDVAHMIHQPIEGREEVEVVENVEPLILVGKRTIVQIQLWWLH